MFALTGPAIAAAWKADGITQPAEVFDRLMFQAAAHHSRGQMREAILLQHQAAQSASQLVDNLNARMNSLGEAAIAAKAYAEALGYYAYTRVFDNRDAQVRRTQILLSLFKDGLITLELLGQECRDFISHGLRDSEAYWLASEVAEALGLKWRAAEFRLKGLRLSAAETGNHGSSEIEARLRELQSLEMKVAEARAKTRSYPNVIFYNMTCSGASALYPILKEVLSEHFGYEMVFTPEKTECLATFSEGPVPLLHWTHAPLETFGSYLYRPDYKFIALYRDPRDVMVSHMKVIKHRNPDLADSERELILSFLKSGASDMCHEATDWYALDDSRCFKLAFEEMKRDMPGVLGRLFEFLGLDAQAEVLSKAAVRHSFESVTQRPRGAEGAVLDTGLFWRKGISGDWVNHFDAELLDVFNQRCGWAMKALGYAD